MVFFKSCVRIGELGIICIPTQSTFTFSKLLYYKLTIEISIPFFLNNLHVVRHTDRLRASLSTYLVIEQTLMRNINSTGGLSRDIGKNVVQRLVWVKSMSFCCNVYSSMQDFTGVAYNTSEQHVEASDT